MTQQENQKKVKLIALDMDGTLLDNKEEVTVENREAIRNAREKGVRVIIATGRSIITCRKYAESLDLLSYLITVNGSEIWEHEGKLMERNPVPSELIEWMWDLSQTYKTKFWASSTDKVWRNEMAKDIKNHQWLKFGYQIEDDQVRNTVLNMLTRNPMLEISNSSPINIEINALGVNKAMAISKVCEELNISMDNVLTIGDSLNDIEMIKKAGIGIAMGNAQEVVKNAADWVTSTNLDNGVAKAIEKWVL